MAQLKKVKNPCLVFLMTDDDARFGAPGSIIEQQESCFTRYTGNNSWQLHYQMHPDSSLQPPGHCCLWLSFVRWVASQLNQNNNKKRRPIIIFTENLKKMDFPNIDQDSGLSPIAKAAIIIGLGKDFT